MNRITIILLGNCDVNKYTGKFKNYIDFEYADSTNIKDKICNVTNKYVAFIKEGDEVKENYLDTLFIRAQKDFDCCYINNSINYEYSKNRKILTSEIILSGYKPYYGEYLWNFVFKAELLIKLMDAPYDKSKFNELVDMYFYNTKAIGEVLYYHNPNNKSYIDNFYYCDVKEEVKVKNAIYVGNGCRGTFNGYISWVKNIGRCFAKDYEITILYDEISDLNMKLFSEYFKCVKVDNSKNYLCDRLLVTYSTYYYPRNLLVLEENYMFIHGNMSDYPNARHYKDDIYTKYLGVSKISAEKAKGYFPTDNIEHLYNPFVLDKKLVKPHMTLVSAQRSTPIKKSERIEILASVFDELEIPYTWNVFTDKNENTNKNGVIYRKRLANPLPYVQDADYFVLLSNSEALPYGIVEALSLNTKVVVTPLEAFTELGVVDGENGIVIPFEYFEPENKEKLIEVVRRIYAFKNKSISYEFDSSLCDGYKEIFK